MKRNLIVLAAIAAFALVGLGGCASFAKNLPVEQLVAQYATLKVIEVGKTTADRTDRAAKITTIATAAKAIVDGGGSSTLNDLVMAVNVKISALHLSPADQLLANGLVAALAAELSDKITGGVLKPDEIVQVDTVLGWVIDAAAMPVG